MEVGHVVKDTDLKLEERQVVGGGRSRRLRERGYVPAVIYGKGMESRSVKLKKSDLREFLSVNGRNAIFTTEFADEGELSAIIKDTQYDPVRRELIHVDFQKVSLTEEIQVHVPVRITGREVIERAGGVVVHQLDEVVVECLPQCTPKYIDADVSRLRIGQGLTAGQLVTPIGVALVTEPHSVILSITGGKTELEVEKTDELVAESSGPARLEQVE